jgi:hypothetical protein
MKKPCCPKNQSGENEIDLTKPLAHHKSGNSWQYDEEGGKLFKFQLFNCQHCQSTLAGNRIAIERSDLPPELLWMFEED